MYVNNKIENQFTKDCVSNIKPGQLIKSIISQKQMPHH